MKSTHWIYWIILLLLLPAFLINLGLMPLIDDEAIRALVAMEMGWSNNLATPTLHGNYYYNKPPLWNWILLLGFELGGQPSEWMARLPAVLCLWAYAGVVFYVVRLYCSPALAWLAALLLLSCGRILYWDSLLALIDICFSGVMFALAAVVFHQGERERWWQLFLWSYLLTAVGFMLKGLPAIVFQGITLLTYLGYRGRWSKLFSVAHLGSGLLCLVLIGSYYWWYHQYNSLDAVFSTLFTESSKRTVVQFGPAQTAWHFLTFPFEMVYHFLPWSLVIVYVIRRDILTVLRANRLVAFTSLAFLANLLPYWTSPEVYPRYLLMLAPLYFGVGLYLHHIHQQENSRAYRLLQALFLVFCVVFSVAWLAPFFVERAQVVQWALPKAGLLLVCSGVFTWLAWRQPTQRWLYLVAVLLVFRIGFNWFVLPDRLANDFGELCRQTSLDAGTRFAGQPLFVYHHTHMQPTNSYYLQRAYGGIIPREVKRFSPDALYIINPAQFPDVAFQPVDSFLVRHGQLTYYIAHISDPLPPRTVLTPYPSLTPLPE